MKVDFILANTILGSIYTNFKDFVILEPTQLPIGEFNKIFQDEFNKILSKQSTNFRFFLPHNLIDQII